MKKNNKQQSEIKTFQYKFTSMLLCLCVAVLLLCAAGIGVSIWRIVQYGIQDFNDVIKYPFLIAVCIFCIVFVVCVLCRSQYLVDGEHVVMQFGFIKTKYEIKKITALTFDRDANKLTVRFGEEYAMLAVNPEWNEQFVQAITDINGAIEYSFTLTEIKK